jgi:uncharacterized protein YfaQ (DUF2300 family)
MRHGLLASALLAAACAAGASAPPQLAWWPAGSPAPQQAPSGLPAVTPLGSSWKVFVYAYLAETQAREAPYRCSAQRAPGSDDGYCCEPGTSVDRNTALARSCGPYFAPQRLRIPASEWRSFWAQKQAPRWLQELAHLEPSTTVPVPELLAALGAVPPQGRQAAREALASVATRNDTVLAAWGSGPRYKTWSWSVDGQPRGGATGWLLDGTPFWLGARGTSQTVLAAHAPWAAQHLPMPLQPDATHLSAQPCVDVHFFQRYPLRQVFKGSTPAPAGPMQGRYRLAFANGTQLVMQGSAGMHLRRPDGAPPEIDGRLPLEAYVARVVDREGQAQPAAAARALAVAARTYVLQNAAEAQACRRMPDDSRTQRVSPNPPSAGAQAAAAFTDGLVLAGSPIRYHRDQAQPGVMAWTDAVQRAEAGAGFVDILRTSYPRSAWASSGGSTAGNCRALPDATAWLLSAQARWQPLLRAEVGFEPVPAVQVCELQMGSPHADQRRSLIRIREWRSREGRVTLLHEYLHLAFRHHPRGQDEAFVEAWAQRLADL